MWWILTRIIVVSLIVIRVTILRPVVRVALEEDLINITRWLTFQCQVQQTLCLHHKSNGQRVCVCAKNWSATHVLAVIEDKTREFQWK